MMDMNFSSAWTWARGGAKSTSGTAAGAKGLDAADGSVGTMRTCTTARADSPGDARAHTIWKYSARSVIDGSMSVFYLAKAIFRFNLGVRFAAARQKRQGQPRIVRCASKGSTTTYTVKGTRASWVIEARSWDYAAT